MHERAPFADRLGHGAVFDVSGMVGTLHDRALSWPSSDLADIHRHVFHVLARPQCVKDVLPDIIARRLAAACLPSNTPTPSARGTRPVCCRSSRSPRWPTPTTEWHFANFSGSSGPICCEESRRRSTRHCVDCGGGGSIASDVGSNRNLPNSQLPFGASYRKVIAGISRFATCGPRGPNENALRQRTFVVLSSRHRRSARACPLWMAPALWHWSSGVFCPAFFPAYAGDDGTFMLC